MVTYMVKKNKKLLTIVDPLKKKDYTRVDSLLCSIRHGGVIRYLYKDTLLETFNVYQDA